MKVMKWLLAIAILCGSFLHDGDGKPEYSKKEGKACTFCHVKLGSKELTAAGQYYQEHNHSLVGYQAAPGRNSHATRLS